MNPIAKQWSLQTLARRRVTEEIRAKQTAAANAANDADANRLAALADEVATLEARLDPEDLSAIQLLAAKRDQHARLKVKFQGDAAARLAAANTVADAQLPAVTVAYSFDKLLDDAAVESRDALRPFFREEHRARQVFNDSDTGAVLRRLKIYGASREEEEKILQAIANGENLPWIFA